MNTLDQNDDLLKLENQLCFPLYAASRAVIRAYQPLLDELGITYPQYLVLLVLWEANGQTVNKIAEKLHLNTNTITPLLKRMENQGILTRERSKQDERKVVISLTDKGSEMKKKALAIPEELMQKMQLETDDFTYLKKILRTLIKQLEEE